MRSHDIVLLLRDRGHARCPCSRLLRRRCCIIAIEYDCHVLQSVPTGFWVEEIHCQSHCDKHNDEHKVVLPADCFEGDRVDKGVEEVGDYYRDPGNGQPMRSEPIWPDLAGIGCQKWRPMSCESARWSIGRDRSGTYRAIS